MSPPLKWYYRPVWVLVVYMGAFVGETVRLYRAVAAEMDALGVGDL